MLIELINHLVLLSLLDISNPNLLVLVQLHDQNFRLTIIVVKDVYALLSEEVV